VSGSPSRSVDGARRAERAASFGGAADQYERYRPGPPAEVVDWLLPEGAGSVVDLGAGTGALSRLLVGRVAEVVAVEPDERMRAVLVEAVPAVRAVAGRGESIPLPDGSADAVLASASWHWMDPLPTLAEVARVLVPGGTLGALWSGPNPDASLVEQAQALLGDGLGEQEERELIQAVTNPDLAAQVLEIPPGAPFDQPEHTVLRWNVAMTADELVGLLGTYSWVIVMEDEARARLFDTARRALDDALGPDGAATLDVEYRTTAWRARRRD
jgi:SAM-dependent methyltransferase